MSDTDRELGSHQSRLNDHDRRLGVLEDDMKEQAKVIASQTEQVTLLLRVTWGSVILVLSSVAVTLMHSIGLLPRMP